MVNEIAKCVKENGEDIGFGFEQDATGYENIILKGLLLNKKPKCLKNKFDEIIDEGDQSIPPGWGKRTEGLLKEVLTDSGEYSSFDGSYNSSVEGVNGFDGVFIKGDLTNYDEIIINESKS